MAATVLPTIIFGLLICHAMELNIYVLIIRSERRILRFGIRIATVITPPLVIDFIRINRGVRRRQQQPQQR